MDEGAGVHKERRDFVIIAALEDEFRAVKQAVGQTRECDFAAEFRVVDCVLEGLDGASISGSICKLHGVGRVEAAVLTTVLLQRVEPRLLLLSGIAGAIGRLEPEKKSKVRLGDVLFATVIADAVHSKVAYGGAMIADRYYEIGHEYAQTFLEVAGKISSASFNPTSDLGQLVKRNSPSFHLGPMISVSAVIADEDVNLKLSKEIASSGPHGFPIGVEMEAIGIAVAAERLGFHRKFAMIRGVNDYANEHKTQQERRTRRAACANSAFAAVEFIKQLAIRERWSRSSVVRTL